VQINISLYIKKSKMSIINITKGNYGGLDHFSREVFNYLSKEFEEKIFYFYPEGNKIYKKFNKSEIFFLEFNGEVIYVNLFRKIKELINCDLIHVHHTKAWILFSPLFLFKDKIVYSLHGNFGSNIKKGLLTKLIILLIINYITIFSQKIICLTNPQKENIQKYCLFKKRLDKKVIIINNFIKKENILKHKKILNDKIIFVGRYTKLKGFEDLINLAKDSKNIHFSLVGEDNFENKLDNIENIGKIDHSQIFKEYDKCSILILPSYTESWGLVITEAMARGLVVLASDLPTIREYFIDGRNGYLFPTGDVEKMKELILYLKNNPKEIERISKNNLKDIWKFTEEKQINKYVKVYEEILKENKKR